jgi:hypothetical protein
MLGRGPEARAPDRVDGRAIQRAIPSESTMRTLIGLPLASMSKPAIA